MSEDSKGRRVLVIDAEQFQEMADSDANLTLATMCLFVAQCKAIGAKPKDLIGDAKHLLDKIKHFK